MVRIKSLDGWRAISVLLVIVGHLVNYRYGHGESRFATLTSYCATLGVNVFFVISGFLITSISLKEEASTGSFSATNFYLRRVFRIVPAFAVYVGAAALLAAFGAIHQSLAGIARAAPFTGNLPGTECGWFVGHTWSLGYEQQFYLLFPLAFLLSLGARKRTMFAIHLVIVATPFLMLVLPASYRDLCIFVGRFSSITMGVLLGLCASQLEGLIGNRKILACAVAAAAWAVIVDGVNILHIPYDLRFAVDMLIVPPAFAWLILWSIGTTGWANSVLNQPVLRYIGAISYSLYLWQQLFAGLPSLYADVAWFHWLLMFPAAALSYHLVEKPFIAMGRWVSDKRKRGGASMDANARPTASSQ